MQLQLQLILSNLKRVGSALISAHEVDEQTVLELG